MSESFCAAAWEQTFALQEAICSHPFNLALADGTLDRERFAFYLAQDARYLVSFSRALAIASGRAGRAEAAAFLAGSAERALVVERSLHTGYLERFGLAGEAAVRIATSPTCLAYGSYLVATAATGEFAVAVAALLPCFWVYQNVGETIARRAGPVERHAYGTWIETYTDEAFAASVATMRRIVDEEAAATGAATRSGMVAAFTRASEYEWLFWESAWSREDWPTRRWLADTPPA